MKNLISILISFIVLFFFFKADGQTNLDFSIKFNINSCNYIGTNNYNVVGNVFDDAGFLSGVDVLKGDSLFYVGDNGNNSVLYSLVVDSIIQVSGNRLILRMKSISPYLSTSSNGCLTGQVVITRKNFLGYPTFPAGASLVNSSAIDNRFKRLIQLSASNTSIYYASGLPNIRPNGSIKMWVDTLSSIIYTWNSTNWTGTGKIISTVAPTITIVTDIVNNVIVKLDNLIWYNPNTNKTYYYSYLNGGGWAAIEDKLVDSAFVHTTGNETVNGKKDFRDSVNFAKGLTANGINTKGMSTTGSSSAAASTINGVQSESIAEISRDTTLDGTYNIINVTLSNSNVILTLPPPILGVKGWKYKIKKKNTSIYSVRIIETNTSFVFNIISDGTTQIFLCDGSLWTPAF